MNPTPQKNDGELIVQRSLLEPVDPKDPESLWERFIDGLRRTVGLKPLFLAERWTTAKVRQEEADADAKIMAAKAQFELAMAEVRAKDLQSQGTFAKAQAEAQLDLARAESVQINNELVKQLFDAKNCDPEEALKHLNEVLQKIRCLGGVVEIDLPDDDSTPE